jgi:hypothetical protein
MAQYAENTAVVSEKSRMEIERILQRYGAEDFAYASKQTSAMIAFTAQGRMVRFTVELPNRAARQFTLTPTGRARSATQVAEEYEQAVRQRWRALALVVKAKLEAVESGIFTFEQEFMPHIVLPGGQTVYEQAAPVLERAYAQGVPLQLLQIGGKS